MDLRRLTLDERCCGRVLLFGIQEGTDQLIDILLATKRVDSVTIIEPDWQLGRAQSEREGVIVVCDEAEDALMPPAEQYDFAIMLQEPKNLADFVETMQPDVFALINRGWLPRSDSLLVVHIESLREELGCAIAAEMAQVKADPEYLDQLAFANTKSLVKLAMQPFFRFVAEKSKTLTLDRVLERYIISWTIAYCETALIPGGYDRFEDFAELDD